MGKRELHAALSKHMGLTPSQLADLLNYTLGLPVRLGDRRILESTVNPCVVATWRRKERVRAEAWCLEILLGKQSKAAINRTPPQELYRAVPRRVREIEQMRQYRRKAG